MESSCGASYVLVHLPQQFKAAAQACITTGRHGSSRFNTVEGRTVQLAFNQRLIQRLTLPDPHMVERIIGVA